MEKRKLIIYHVLTDRNIGGAGRWLLNYLKYCNRSRFDVHVVLPADSQLCEAVRKLKIPVVAMDAMQDLAYDKEAMHSLVALFRKEKPDVVHTHASLTARMAARKAHVPQIFHTKHCMEAVSGNICKKLIKRIINHRYSDTIIAVSKAVRRSMIAGGTDPKQIVTIYNGIEMLQPLSAEEKQAVLAAYGVLQGQKVIGMAARLEAVKDHDTFLHAAARVCEKRKDVTFLVIGDGSRREWLESEAVRMGIADRVRFTGFVTEVERLEAALDVAVMTSKEEALCLSLIEAMSAGVPVIGTDSGGISEVVRHGETGYLIPVGDEEQWADRILELLSEEARRLQMGQKAMAWTREMFRAEQMAAKMEKLYLEAERR